MLQDWQLLLQCRLYCRPSTCARNCRGSNPA